MITAGLLFAVPVIVLAVALVVAAKIYAGAPPRLAESKDLRQLRRARRSAVRLAHSNLRQGMAGQSRKCWEQVDILDRRIGMLLKEQNGSPAVAATRGRSVQS